MRICHSGDTSWAVTNTLRTSSGISSMCLMVPVLAMAGAVAGLRASFPRFAIAWVGLWIVISLLMYVPAQLPPPDTSWSVLASILAALGLGGFAALALDSRA